MLFQRQFEPFEEKEVPKLANMREFASSCVLDCYIYVFGGGDTGKKTIIERLNAEKIVQKTHTAWQSLPSI